MTAQQNKWIEQLYLEMYDPLMAYARSALENEALAEEAVQETFRIACVKPQELLASPKPKGWLVNALKNTIRNTIQSRAKARRLLVAYSEALARKGAVAEDSISLEVTYEDVAQTEEFLLLKELAIEGKSHLEMARERGISVDACRKRVQRAKNFLRGKI